MDEPRSSLYFILLIVFLAINAFVNLSRDSIMEMSSSKLEDDSDDGNVKARLILKMTENEHRFSAQAHLASSLTCLLAFVFSLTAFTGFFVNALAFCGNYAFAASGAVIAILFAFFQITVCERVPERIAIKHSDKVAYDTCGGLNAILSVVSPLETLMHFISKALASLFGVNPSAEADTATEEDILDLIDDANESGNIEETEKEMINNIFELDDRSVGEVMTHRIDLTALEIGAPVSDAVDLAISDGYSRIPVYEETIDNIKGILYAKDLLSLIGDKNVEHRLVSDFIRPVNFIPESNSCREAFLEFQQKKIQAAIVIDEYGGTAGLVSMEDLIESVMGSIQDEYDNEEEEIAQIDSDNFDFDGSVSLDDIEDTLDIDVPDDADYDTLGGLIMDILGRIPEEGEQPSVIYQGIEFTVIQTEEHRIEKVHARRLREEEKDS